MTITGIYPALISPYDSTGAVSPQRMAELVTTLNSQGADGYLVSGSSAECYLLDTDERLVLLDAVVEAADGRTVISHVGTADQRETLRLARTSASAGAHAICANIPTYFTYSDTSLKTYFREVKSQTDLPLLAYYIPSQTGRIIDPDLFLELAHEGTIQGIKYTDSDLAGVARISADRPEGFSILGGADDVLLGALALGADGGIGSSYNVACTGYAALFQSFQEGQLSEARTVQHALSPLLRLMQGWEFIGFLKSILRNRGFAVGQPRSPMTAVTPAHDAQLRDAIDGIAELRKYLIPQL